MIHKSISKILIFFCLGFFILKNSFAQNDVPYGEIPFVKNYGVSDYLAQSQNWDVIQADNGLLYFANDMLILEFDGQNWKKIYLPEKSKPRSLEKSNDGKIYVGATNEFGYLERNEKGAMQFHSLCNDIEKDFGEVWYTFALEDQVYFFTNKKVFISSGQRIIEKQYPVDHTMKTITLVNDLFILSFADLDNNQKKFLFKMKNSTFSKIDISKTPEIVPVGIFNYRPNLYLVFSKEGDIYTLKNVDNKEVEFGPIKNKNVFNLPEGKITSISSGINLYSITFSKKGVWLYDKNGNFIRKIDTDDGLENLVIRKCFFDKDYNLWLANDFGISKIDLSSPVTFFDKRKGISSASEDIFFNKDQFWLGTRSGIYLSDSLSNKSSTKFRYTDIFNFECYDLNKSFFGDLLVVGNDGVYSVNLETKERKIIDYIYAWKLENSLVNKNNVYVGLYNDGLGIMNRNDDEWSYNDIKNTDGNVRDLKEYNRDLYYSVTGKGVVKLDSTKNQINNYLSGFDTTLSQSDFTLDVYNDKLYIGSAHGLFVLDSGNQVVPFDALDGFLNKKDLLIHRIFNDNNNRLWVVMFHNSETEFEREEVGYLSYVNNQWEWHSSELKIVSKDIINAFEVDNRKRVWMAGGSGVYVYNNILNSKIDDSFPTYISRVKVNDSVFHNYFFESVTNSIDIDYENNQLRFEVASPSFYGDIDNEFRFKLIGYKDSWSDWSPNNWIDYTKLQEGTYTFVAQSRNYYGIESELISYKFTILPPWYRTWWAYSIYVVGFGLLMFLIIKLSIRRIKNQNIRLEEIVQERTSEIANKNDELEFQKAEIEEKNNDILSSIQYAQRLQNAILPSQEKISQSFNDHFVLFKPKDIVSGDFYWLQRVGDFTFFAAVDCTGHGVPGSIVSIVGNNGLNRCINEFQLKSPSDILDKLTFLVTESFNSENDEVKDGMDIALCAYNHKTKVLSYAGANNPLWMFRKGKCGSDDFDNDSFKVTYDESINISFIEVKADKQPIGSFEHAKPFNNYSLKLQEGDTIYLFSDGFIDQFGGDEPGMRKRGGKKFKSKPFRNLLLSLQNQPMDEQRKVLDKTIEKWRGEIEQIDDICIMSVRI